MVKVLVVDDSAFMRNALSNMLSSDPEVQVIGTARDGIDAVAKVKTLKPDIVTLDVEMPRMDGIEALKIIMAETPVPVVMVSSLTEEGAAVTLQALEIGALDFIPKNLHDLSVNILKLKPILVERIKILARKRLIIKRAPVARKTSKTTQAQEKPTSRHATAARRMGVFAIGTSTGGPKALQEILPNLPKDFPVPIVIAQHMPANFTGPFAERLNQLSKIRVKEAKEGDKLEPGLALIAPGATNMRVKRTGAIDVQITISSSKEEFIYCPSVDALFTSLVEAFPGRSLGLILTGMGNDGLVGSKALKADGGRIFAQDEETCIVYGMPKAVVDANLADKVLSLEQITGEIINAV
jgi:two-component system chemotaxis response regulator CheB